MKEPKVLFVTNMCTHYVRPLFEILASRYPVKFFFTGGHEGYWHKNNELKSGAFDGQYLPGFFIGSLKITPRLFTLDWLGSKVVIKTIDDRFALPFVFCAAKLLRKPFILWTGLWAHPETGLHQKTFAITKFIYRHSDAIVTYGEHVSRYLVGIGIDASKVFAAPHATDNSAYNRTVSDDEKAQLRTQLGLTVADKIILYVGRLEEGKGLDYCIDACERLNGRSTLVLVGTGSKEAQLRQTCEAKNVKVVFAHHVPNEALYKYYAIADIFTLPSITTIHFKEPWGMVINEAMNQACAIVTTDAVGAAAGALIEDGKTGLIVKEKDAQALYEAYLKLLDNDELRYKMGQAARLKIDGWIPEGMAQGFKKALEYVSNNH